jgi:hypothetical protein
MFHTSVMLYVLKQNDILLSVIMLNVIMLNVIMLNVIMLNVIIFVTFLNSIMRQYESHQDSLSCPN